MEYYDAILAGIPAVLGVGVAAGMATSVPLNLGVAAGGLASASPSGPS